MYLIDSRRFPLSHLYIWFQGTFADTPLNIHASNFSKYKMNFLKAYILFVSKKGRGNKSESVYTSVDFTSAEIKAWLGSAVFEIAVALCCWRIIWNRYGKRTHGKLTVILRDECAVFTIQIYGGEYVICFSR